MFPVVEIGDDVTRFWLGEVYVVFKYVDVRERCEGMRDLECVCFCIYIYCSCVVEGDIWSCVLGSQYVCDLVECWASALGPVE